MALDRERWDLDALRAGAMVALVFAVPLSIGASWAAGRDDTALAVWLLVGATGGFVLGAGCAAWVQRVGLPLSHGIAASAGTYAVAQTVFIVIKLMRGGDVNWFGALFNLSVTVGAGLAGGLLGGRMRDRGFRPSTERNSP